VLRGLVWVVDVGYERTEILDVNHARFAQTNVIDSGGVRVGDYAAVAALCDSQPVD
jgi:hypothetical protein